MPTILWDKGFKLGLLRLMSRGGKVAFGNMVLITGVVLERRMNVLNIGNSPRFAGPPVDFLGVCFVRPMVEHFRRVSEKKKRESMSDTTSMTQTRVGPKLMRPRSCYSVRKFVIK